jgi:hypothetical protein
MVRPADPAPYIAMETPAALTGSAENHRLWQETYQ